VSLPWRESGGDDIIEQLDRHPTPAQYMQAARDLTACKGAFEPVRIALLASFTAEPLLPYLTVECARDGFAAETFVGAFNNVVQELVSPAGACVRHRPDVVFAAQQLEDVAPELTWEYLSLSDVAAEAAITRVAATVCDSVATFRQQSSAAVVVHNFELPRYPALGLADLQHPRSQTATIARLNALLASRLTVPDSYVLDYERLIAEVGVREWRDNKMWRLGRAPLSAHALIALARQYAAFIRALRRPAAKCLVLDLDDTLWGGVLGEVGAERLHIGESYPGNVFRDFQRAVRQLKDRGVLLALNSKNNLGDVEAAFTTRHEMVLRLEDFAAIRVNWQSKPANMIDIGEELNLGLDSFVFVDDNPVEREEMRRTLPQVTTLALPPSPFEYTRALHECRAFARLNVTKEDRQRTQLYRAEATRRHLAQRCLNLEEFLASLNMRVTITPVDAASLERVVDLIRKTNQFNLTTRRYSAAEVARMIADSSYGVFCLRLVDRFGDNGIVGVAIVRESQGVAHLDTLLLSCRVIGRTVETALLAYVVQWSRQRGLRQMDGEFVPTAKNAPAADFFARHQFDCIAQDRGAVHWRLPFERTQIERPRYIAVEVGES
jgi:FkbH-like protein